MECKEGDEGLCAAARYIGWRCAGLDSISQRQYHVLCPEFHSITWI